MRSAAGASGASTSEACTARSAVVTDPERDQGLDRVAPVVSRTGSPSRTSISAKSPILSLSSSTSRSAVSCPPLIPFSVARSSLAPDRGDETLGREPRQHVERETRPDPAHADQGLEQAPLAGRCEAVQGELVLADVKMGDERGLFAFGGSAS